MKHLVRILVLALTMGAMQASIANYHERTFKTINVANSNFKVATDRVSAQIKLKECKRCSKKTYYIKKLIIAAEGVRNDAMMEVLVNGDVKGTVYVPGRDPSYIVTVNEVASSIEFIGLRGTTRVLNIKAVVSETYEGSRRRTVGPHGMSARNHLANVSLDIIELIDVLEGYTNHNDYGQYLLPIKKAAARAYAKAQVRGEASAQVHDAFLVLANKIASSVGYLDETFERSNAFEAAVDMIRLSEEIKDLLD